MSILFGSKDQMSRMAIISPDASDDILVSLKKIDIEPVALPRTVLVSPPISGHPDIQLFPHDGRVFCHPDIEISFIKKIGKKAEVVVCTAGLSPEYPGDVPYNIACAGNCAFHHRSGINHSIGEHLQSRGVVLAGVSQGYAKCSSMVVNDDAIITADRSIHKSASDHGIMSLLIRTGHIDLPGYAYGFIGGASGRIDDMLLVAGDLSLHPDYEKIVEYIYGTGKKLIFLSRKKAVDLGSIYIIS